MVKTTIILFFKKIKQVNTINISNLLKLVANLSLFVWVLHYVYTFLWIEVSLKNYVAFSLWVVYETFFIHSPLLTQFHESGINFGHMILFNEEPLLWEKELNAIYVLCNADYQLPDMFPETRVIELVSSFVNSFYTKLDVLFNLPTLLVIFVFIEVVKISLTNYSSLLRNVIKKKFNILTWTSPLNQEDSSTPNISIQANFFIFIVDFFLNILTIITLFGISFKYFRIIAKLQFYKYTTLHTLINRYGVPTLLYTLYDIYRYDDLNADLFEAMKILENEFNKDLAYLVFTKNTLIWDSWHEFLVFKNSIILKIFNTAENTLTSGTTLNISRHYLYYQSFVFYFVNFSQYTAALLFFFLKKYFLQNLLQLTTFICTIKLTWIFVSLTGLFWRPLFKRWSYIGLFFKTRTSWLQFNQLNEIEDELEDHEYLEN